MVEDAAPVEFMQIWCIKNLKAVFALQDIPIVNFNFFFFGKKMQNNLVGEMNI